MRIIYQNADETISVLIPAPDCLVDLVARTGDLVEALKLVAEKDVPHGLPYWIVDTGMIPTDRADRDLWRLDGSQGEPHGYGGESSEFQEGVLL